MSNGPGLSMFQENLNVHFYKLRLFLFYFPNHTSPILTYLVQILNYMNL